MVSKIQEKHFKIKKESFNSFLRSRFISQNLIAAPNYHINHLFRNSMFKLSDATKVTKSDWRISKAALQKKNDIKDVVDASSGKSGMGFHLEIYGQLQETIPPRKTTLDSIAVVVARLPAWLPPASPEPGEKMSKSPVASFYNRDLEGVVREASVAHIRSARCRGS